MKVSQGKGNVPDLIITFVSVESGSRVQQRERHIPRVGRKNGSALVRGCAVASIVELPYLGCLLAGLLKVLVNLVSQIFHIFCCLLAR